MKANTAIRFLCQVLLGAVFLWVAPPAEAQVMDTEILTINATVSTRAELVLSPTTINFPDANPTTTPSIPADSTVAVTARVRTGSGSTPTLTVLAAGDLISGGDSIAINNVTWTAAPPPFIAGTMSNAASQSAATFGLGSAQYTGTYTFAFANSWAYNTGSYTQTATYTLTSP